MRSSVPVGLEADCTHKEFEKPCKQQEGEGKGSKKDLLTVLQREKQIRKLTRFQSRREMTLFISLLLLIRCHHAGELQFYMRYSGYKQVFAVVAMEAPWKHIVVFNAHSKS